MPRLTLLFWAELLEESNRRIHVVLTFHSLTYYKCCRSLCWTRSQQRLIEKIGIECIMPRDPLAFLLHRSQGINKSLWYHKVAIVSVAWESILVLHVCAWVQARIATGVVGSNPQQVNGHPTLIRSLATIKSPYQPDTNSMLRRRSIVCKQKLCMYVVAHPKSHIFLGGLLKRMAKCSSIIYHWKKHLLSTNNPTVVKYDRMLMESSIQFYWMIAAKALNKVCSGQQKHMAILSKMSSSSTAIQWHTMIIVTGWLSVNIIATKRRKNITNHHKQWVTQACTV